MRRRWSRSCATAASGFKRRREALERIQGAAGELERRITEVQAQDERLTTVDRARSTSWPLRCARLAADAAVGAANSAERAPHLSLVRAKPAPSAAPAEAAGGSA